MKEPAEKPMPQIQIDDLGHHPDAIPVIAQWHQDEWQHISPHLTTASRIALYRSYSNTPAIPCCFLAHDKGRPVGSASLVECDMDTHSHLTPWLASVYVETEHRQQGIASRLITQCLNTAREYNIKAVYLFTPDATEFYLNRGWTLLEQTTCQNEKVDIMYYELTHQNPS